MSCFDDVAKYGPSKKPADASTIARARELREQGLTYVQIAARLGYSAGTVRKLVNTERKERDPRASWKTAAQRIGVTLEEYTSRREGGERWCTVCKSFKYEAAMKASQSQCLECASDAGRKR